MVFVVINVLWQLLALRVGTTGASFCLGNIYCKILTSIEIIILKIYIHIQH